MLKKTVKTGVSSLKKPTKLKEPASTLMRIVGLLLGALLTVIGFVALSYYPEDGWLQLLGGLGFLLFGLESLHASWHRRTPLLVRMGPFP